MLVLSGERKATRKKGKKTKEEREDLPSLSWYFANLCRTVKRSAVTWGKEGGQRNYGTQARRRRRRRWRAHASPPLRDGREF